MMNVEPHPLLELRAFITEFSQPLGTATSDLALRELLTLGAAAPMQSSDEVRAAVRDLLRHGGFKPTGRSKPASEYLMRAAGEGELATINLAVDACNAVSLHSGLPISVVDLELARSPFRVGVAGLGLSYVFNASGQIMDVGGLLCLFDAEGPCANAVKDSQRTKTHAATRRTLSLIWGTRQLPGRAAQAESWYRVVLETHGARTESALS